MPESTTTRLRDRVSKRDRDRERERLSRGKRRRENMALHGGRDEGDDSSDESLGEDEDDEEEDDMSMPSRSHNPSTSSVSQGTNHHHNNQNHQNHHVNHGSNNQSYNSYHQQQQRKSLLRLPARWRADEMIGVPVPRKARTGTGLNSHRAENFSLWLISSSFSYYLVFFSFSLPKKDVEWVVRNCTEASIIFSFKDEPGVDLTTDLAIRL